VRPLSSHAALLEASGGDLFIRWQVRADVPLQAWEVGGAVAFVRTRASGRRQLTVVGSPHQAATAVRALVGPDAEPAALQSAGAHGVTVPRGTLPLLGDDVRVGAGDDWEWMWADASTLAGIVADDRVVRLPDSADDEVARLLSVASPRHSSDPGDDDVLAWFGIRTSEGELVACAACTESVPGVPHLASIATHPRLRGHGLGTALTATVTAQLLQAGAPVVTLGMYSDNAVARRMYARIGYVCEHRWSSRAIVVRQHGRSGRRD
jgi:ribosomal protein S18 acetylase RimI-like enzyme